MRPCHVIKLTAKQRQALEKIVGRVSNPAGVVRRARVVLLSAAGVPAFAIAERLDLSAEAVSRRNESRRGRGHSRSAATQKSD